MRRAGGGNGGDSYAGSNGFADPISQTQFGSGGNGNGNASGNGHGNGGYVNSNVNGNGNAPQAVSKADLETSWRRGSK